jgi:hypothetical protein
MQRLVLFKRLVDVARESERESRQSIFGLLIVCLLWLAIDGEDDPEQAFAVYHFEAWESSEDLADGQ